MTSLDEPRSEMSDESDSDSDVLNVTVTRTVMNSEAEDKRESINLRVGSDCTIEELKDAIKNKLALGKDAADFLLFYPWEVCLDDHHSKETKLIDLGHPVDILSMEYPTAGKISDKLFPPVPVIIKSDEVRKIVLPHKLGRSPGKYWDDCEINSTERRIQLSSIDFFGQELRLWIEDPTQSEKSGTCRTLGFKLPRSTRKVLVRKDSENPDKFNLYCELKSGPEKVIKDDDWTFADRPGPNGNKSEWGEWDVKFIKFSEGVFRPFLVCDQKREQVWDAYGKPLIPLAEAGVGAAAGLI